jgi:outer membrane protein OmpA-like peptidoglycan-associated protein
MGHRTRYAFFTSAFAFCVAGCVTTPANESSGGLNPLAQAPAASASAPEPAPPTPTTTTLSAAAPSAVTTSLQPSTASVATTAAAPPQTVLPFDEAIAVAAKQVLDAGASTVGEKAVVVIDPLIDGSTGAQTNATQLIGERLAQMAQAQYPKLEVKRFSGQTVSQLPLVLIGTFTPINLAGKPDGERDVYRVWFTLVDLKSGKVVSKGFARAKTDGVDHTPLSLYRDGPVWVADREVLGYVRTCQSVKVGEPVDPMYVDAVMAAALIEEAHQTLISGRVRDAIALYNTAMTNPRGAQARTLAGLYTAYTKARQPAEAMKMFSRLVDMGLANKRLAVQFGFSGMNSNFGKDGRLYDGWIKEIGAQMLKSKQCIEIGGHVSRTSNEAISERLSQQRAELVRQRLLSFTRGLERKITVIGHGARHNVVGTGTHNDTDLFDRRIEFKPVEC